MYDKEELKKRGLISTGRSLPYNPKLKERAKYLRSNLIQHEKRLWFFFLNKCGYKWRRQHPIDNDICDFYCPELKLVIEIDGESHNSEFGKTYDYERDQILNSYGLKILRFSNQEIINNLNNVCSEISKFFVK